MRDVGGQVLDSSRSLGIVPLGSVLRWQGTPIGCEDGDSTTRGGPRGPGPPAQAGSSPLPPTTPSSHVSDVPGARGRSHRAEGERLNEEIYAILKPILKHHTPKPSTIYAITRRHGVNRLTTQMQQAKGSSRGQVELGQVDS